MATKAELALGSEYVRGRLECRDGVLYRNGKPAGTKVTNGYIRLLLSKDGVKYSLAAHRVIWMLHNGGWPSQVIDHINRNRADNRIENLRDVPPIVNARNNGNPTGIGSTRKGKKFAAQIHRDGATTYIGVFNTQEEAHQAYLATAAAMDQKESARE